MSTHDAVRHRLAAQFLTATTDLAPDEIVRVLGAVQSQDYAGGKWALAQRAAGATDRAIEAAFADGRILRTHVLRPTWHFVTPADIRWMLALTAPRVKRVLASYDRRLEIDEAVLRRSQAAITRALAGGRSLTRRELAVALHGAGVGSTSGSRLAHLVMHAELDGIICSGPRRDSQLTYALLEERVPPAPPLGRDEALHELARRYFLTRGPATLHDFAWWSGLTIADARRAVAMLGDTVERVTLDGRDAWFRPSTTRSRATAHLLPNYDEYFIGLRDRRAIARRLGSAALVTGGDARIGHVVVVDGELVGGWRSAADRDAPAVRLELLVELTNAERRRVEVARRRYEAYTGG